jgi:glycosyltransferase involved in cell wall biosynthesis
VTSARTDQPPVVTVIVPVRDGERFLGSALASIAAQEYEPLDVVVVDDGSVDASRAIAQGFAAAHAPGVRVLDQPNAGPAAARNRGLAIARGDLVTFLDADDEMMPGRLHFQVGYLVANPGVDAVIGREEIVVEPGVEPPPWVRRLPPGASTYQPVSLMVWRRWFEQVGAFDESYRTGEDTEWLSRLVTRGGRLDRVEQVTVRRRMHGANLTYRGVGQNLTRFLHARVRERKGLA